MNVGVRLPHVNGKIAENKFFRPVDLRGFRASRAARIRRIGLAVLAGIVSRRYVPETPGGGAEGVNRRNSADDVRRGR